MIHKMHAFDPLVIRGKMERNYKTDYLPTPRNAFAEYSRWERRWKTVPKEYHLDFVAKVLKVCDIDLYPNIYVLLNIRVPTSARNVWNYIQVWKSLESL